MSKRREKDFYETPHTATLELLRHVPIDGSVLEVCSGDNAIANVLFTATQARLFTNDLDPKRFSDFQMNAAIAESWRRFPHCDWVVTNPPFKYAPAIVRLAIEHATEGVAMLLRLSFLEPCDNRSWLAQTPPNDLIILPRISFTGNGKTDSCTTAWFVWYKAPAPQRLIVVPKRTGAGRGDNTATAAGSLSSSTDDLFSAPSVHPAAGR